MHSWPQWRLSEQPADKDTPSPLSVIQSKAPAMMRSSLRSKACPGCPPQKDESQKDLVPTWMDLEEFDKLCSTWVEFPDSPLSEVSTEENAEKKDLSNKFKEVLDRVAAEGHGCLPGFEELLEQVATQSDNAVFDDFMFRIKDATTFKKLENRLRIAGQTTRLDAVRLRRFRVRKAQLQSKADAASALRGSERENERGNEDGCNKCFP